MVRHRIKTALFYLFILIFLGQGYLLAAQDYLRDLERRDLTPYDQKLRTDTKLYNLPDLKDSQSTEFVLPDPSKYKSPTEIKETRIKPSYGKEKKEKKKQELKIPEFKIDPNWIHYIEILLFIFLIIFFVRKEMRKYRQKELKKNQGDTDQDSPSRQRSHRY